MFKITFPVVILLGSVSLTKLSTACNSKSTEESELEVFPTENTAPGNLTFSAGDIISCKLTPNVSHVMLASDNASVIHVMEHGEPGRAIIKEQNFLTLPNNSLFDKCHVITSWYGQKIQESCHGGQNYTMKTTEEATANARESVKLFSTRRHALYSLSHRQCNSEHWVSSWRYGVAWSLQPRLVSSSHGHIIPYNYASAKCDCRGVRHCQYRCTVGE